MMIRMIGMLVLLATTGVLQAQTVRYIHTDALGSVVAVTDANRNVIERREYEPYGAQLTPALSDGLGYTGHVQDAATGLAYMQQRYYDPGIGRFLSIDPVTADGNTGGNFNRYWYANNTPYKFKDPDGRMPCGRDSSCQEFIRKAERRGIFPSPPPEPEDDRTEPVTLGTISVVAPRPAPAPVSIPWGKIRGSLVGGGSISLILITGMWPYDMGFSACEMPDGPPCGMMSGALRPGYWPGDTGSEEWGRRNGVGAKEGRGRFHGIKQSEKGQGGGRGREVYGVNPDTGDVVNPAGEVVGNLDEVKSK